MCGIAGWIDFERDLTGERATLAAMTGALRHRGPDSHGLHLSRHAALGHQRLAVLDSAGGQQPMTDDEVIISYNGEIYNFAGLRSELASRGHRFDTRSDTEVVLRAYRQWGPGLAARLDGMFAFAIWDGAREQLILARDRLGIKPLYFHRYRHGLILGSEPKAVFANPLYTAAVDEADLPALLNARLGLPGTTPLRGLLEVPPGHIMELSRRGLRRTCYWRLEARDHQDDYPTTVSTIREMLEDVVERHLVADVPVSTLLSGGLDSSALAAIARRSGRLRAFSLDDAATFRPSPARPNQDAPYARRVAQHLDVPYTGVDLDVEAVARAEPAARTARDLPSLGEYDASLYLLCAEVRRHATVTLSGEGADELFGGYPWFREPEHVWANTFPWIDTQPRLSECLAPEIRRRITPGRAERELYATLVERTPRRPADSRLEARMRETLFANLNNPLTFLLDRQDRMSMAVGLEVRVPYCDHRLVEYLWNVPWSMKNADGEGKTLLRAAVADLLPADVLSRAKVPYPSIIPSDFGATVAARTRAMLRDASSPLGPALDHVRVEGLAQRVPRSAASARLLDRLLRVDTWAREQGVSLG